MLSISTSLGFSGGLAKRIRAQFTPSKKGYCLISVAPCLNLAEELTHYLLCCAPSSLQGEKAEQVECEFPFAFGTKENLRRDEANERDSSAVVKRMKGKR
ncbi:hypothetical protein NE237_029229 [Protea cynaroides]|uniref:Uncharacterized protein n=1 Tax=Protea cynaroides TaxID=273540 RepID=A0A9Q0JUW6_9MAGN|nr:hypothetical protein NE237_029229 [Protea cynaroides]